MHRVFTSIVGAYLLAISTFSHAQERPTAPKLFPENTLAYVRIDDSRELKAKLAESASGKMANDPQIAPLIQEFYRTFNETFVGVQREFGIDLDEILGIPNGELAIGMVPGKNHPEVIVLIEAGDEMPALELMVARAEEQSQRRGGLQDSKEISRIEIVQWRSPTNEDRQFGYFVDSGCLVICSSADMIEDLAKIWTGNGVDHKPLSNNRKFTSILSRCVGLEGERPQLSFYVDPFALIKETNKNDLRFVAFLPILANLGIDGIQAVGGSVIFVPQGFDSLVHAHLLLDNPRRGMLDVIRPKTGDTQPPAWVSEDVARYFTANWNMATTLVAVGELYDMIRGPDSFQNEFFATIDRNLGVDFEKDLLKDWADRITMTQVMLRPARVDNISRLFAFKLKNPQTFDRTLKKIYDHLKAKDGKWTTASFGSVTIYTRPNNADNPPTKRRRPEPALAILGDDLLVADSRQAIDMAITSFQNGEGLLRESLEYQLVQGQIKQQLGNSSSSIVLYDRPEEAMRMMYDMAADPNNRDALRAAKDVPIAAALLKALESNQLPPFEAISKYLSPIGGYITEEENGLHFTGFGLRRQP